LLWVGSIATSKYDPNLIPEKTKFRIAMGIPITNENYGFFANAEASIEPLLKVDATFVGRALSAMGML